MPKSNDEIRQQLANVVSMVSEIADNLDEDEEILEAEHEDEDENEDDDPEKLKPEDEEEETNKDVRTEPNNSEGATGSDDAEAKIEDDLPEGTQDALDGETLEKSLSTLKSRLTTLAKKGKPAARKPKTRRKSAPAVASVNPAVFGSLQAIEKTLGTLSKLAAKNDGILNEMVEGLVDADKIDKDFEALQAKKGKPQFTQAGQSTDVLKELVNVLAGLGNNQNKSAEKPEEDYFANRNQGKQRQNFKDILSVASGQKQVVG